MPSLLPPPTLTAFGPLGVVLAAFPLWQVCRGKLGQKSLPRHRVLDHPDDHRLRVLRGPVDRGSQLLCVSVEGSVFLFFLYCFFGDALCSVARPRLPLCCKVHPPTTLASLANKRGRVVLGSFCVPAAGRFRFRVDDCRVGALMRGSLLISHPRSRRTPPGGRTLAARRPTLWDSSTSRWWWCWPSCSGRSSRGSWSTSATSSPSCSVSEQLFVLERENRDTAVAYFPRLAVRAAPAFRSSVICGTRSLENASNSKR